MKTGRLRQMNGFWRSLSFIGNECKMRNALMEYLKEEGLKCQLEDGIVIFDYNESHYSTHFQVHDGFAECEICYETSAEDYGALELSDKTFIADKTNTEVNNHCKVLAFDDSLRIETSFYFTNKRMMINLFSHHFDELNESLSVALDIACGKVDAHKANKSRCIGFVAEAKKRQEDEPQRVEALRRSWC